MDKFTALYLQNMSSPSAPHPEATNQTTWPLDYKYYSPLNSQFISKLDISALHKGRHKILLRDGKKPVLELFNSHPKPFNKNLFFYLHKDSRSFVPPRWQENIKLYEVVKFKAKNSKEFKNICITGIIFPEDKNLATHLTTLYSEIKKTLKPTKYEKIKKYFFLANTQKPTKLPPWPPHSYRLSGYDFFSKAILNQSLCVNLSSKTIIADDFITHFILSKNGYLKDVRSVEREKCHLELSPYHGMVFTDIF